MQVSVKIFLNLLIIESIKCELRLCDNAKADCDVNEVKLSGAETADLRALFQFLIKYFNELEEKYESKINAITDDIGDIRRSLQSGNCTAPAEHLINTAATETTEATADSLYGDLWLVIQRRQDGSTDFHRSWYHYKQGFGHPFREFFIGLDKLHFLTSSARHELLIRMEDFKGHIKYALYDEFVVGNETERYQLKKLGKYSGNAGDYLRIHEGMYFSTKNVDNDASDALHCAQVYQGGWWYNNCMTSNLNGPFRRRYIVHNINMTWGFATVTQLKIVQMMVRLRTWGRASTRTKA